MEIREIFAFNLRKYRKQQQLSQTELAARANLNRTYISVFERGAYAASLDVVGQLARALGLTPLELLTHPTLQQSPNELKKAMPPIGPDGSHVVEIPISTLPVHECGALLLSFFGYPDISSEAFSQRLETEWAICNKILKKKGYNDPAWASSVQMIRPCQLTLSDQDTKRVLGKFGRRVMHRFAVAKVAGVMLLEGLEEAWQKKAPEGGKHLSLDQASELLASYVREKETVNVSSRVWSPSFPVVHLAMALQLLSTKTFGALDIGPLIELICFSKDALLYALEAAEQFEFALSYAPRLATRRSRLIQFRAA